MNDFAGPRDIAAGGRVTYGTDDGLMVEFEIKPLLLEYVSKERGMPTYEDRVYTRIVAPGNSKTVWYHETKGIDYILDEDGQVVDFRVSELLESGEQPEPVRFPNAWARFKAKGEKIKEGWAIEQWGAITRSFAETLKAMNIHTVEALASLSDANAQAFMGGLKFRNLAKAALSDQETLELASKEQERANKAEEENKQLRRDIEGLKAQMSVLMASQDGGKKHKAA